MEALVAVGLASNIVQFVDYAANLLAAARELHSSAQGATKENEEVELLARGLRQLAETQNLRLLAEKTQPNDFCADNSDAGVLKSLSELCIQVADELIVLLDTLKVKEGHRSAEIVYRAVRTVWKKEDIISLQKRLDKISYVLNHQVRQKQETLILGELRVLQEDNQRLHATREKDISELKALFLNTFQERNVGLRKKDDRALTRAWLQLSPAAERGKELWIEQYILQELYYVTIDDRRFAIPEEHAKTFQWIFNTETAEADNIPPVNFVKWLRGDSSLFWVTGRPGSGKSTLMKFAVAHQDVVKHLKESEWASSCPVIIASHFFWNAAKDPLQKSQAGLLRSILYQILLQRPSLIAVAFPTSRAFFEKDLPLSDLFRDVPRLLGALKNIFEAVASHHIKFCFFIDGLDEYDGNPARVIQLIELLRQSPNIKVCVSSRPWNEFQAHFGTGDWKLSIHDLTKNDIRTYVEDKLGANAVFTELRKSDWQYPDLVTTIINSAHGVFLWVVLVVRSLLEGLTNADRIDDLQKRLEEIPTDLEAFFESIISTVEARYRRQMANTFITSLEAFGSLPPLFYWFFDELDVDAEYAFKLDAIGLPEREIESRVDQSVKRLNARCKGLLEARMASRRIQGRELPHLVVDFLHRTVRDFLVLDSMHDRLNSWSGGHCQVDFNICSGIVAMLKSAPFLSYSDYWPKRSKTSPGCDTGLTATTSSHWPHLMEIFLEHCKRLQQHEPDSLLSKRLPQELQRSLHVRGIFNYYLWTKDGEMSTEVALRRTYEASNPPKTDKWFILACLGAGLAAYVRQELENDPSLVNEIGLRLLLAALKLSHSDSNNCDYEWGSENVDLVRIILQKGVDPNRRVSVRVYDQGLTGGGAESVWETYVKTLINVGTTLTLKERLRSSNSLLCCQALLEHGARLDFYISPTPSDMNHYTRLQPQPAYSLLQDIFTVEQYSTLKNAYYSWKSKYTAAFIKAFSKFEADDAPDRGCPPPAPTKPLKSALRAIRIAELLKNRRRSKT